MARFCKKCGSSLAEGANYCRQCGASTGPIGQPAPVSEPLPTTLLDRTEPMTAIMGEPARTAPPQSPARSKSGSRPLVLVGGVVLLLAVVAGAFHFGARWTSRNQPTGTDAIPTHEAVPGSQPQPSVATPVEPQANASKASPSRGVTPPKAPKPETPNAPTVEPQEATRSAQDILKDGLHHFESGQYSEALAAYEQVQRLDRANRDVHYLAGLAHEKLGDLDAALKAFEQCTSGPYANVSKQHVKSLKKRLKTQD
jgi:hypothetical protein